MYKQQQLSRPVSYQDFREMGPRVSMTTKMAKETMHPWEWGCHWSTRMRFTWIKLPDSATSHNSFALKARACYRQSQTSHACRLNLSNMKCCFAEAKLKKDCNFPTIYPSTKREWSLLTCQHDDIGSGKIKGRRIILFSSHLNYNYCNALYWYTTAGSLNLRSHSPRYYSEGTR